MNFRVALRGGAIVLVLVIGFLAGVWTDQAYPEWVPYVGHRTTARIDLTGVQEASRLIQADYVNSNVDTAKLSHGSVQGLVSSLGDPYSIYFDPDQYKRLQESYQGRYTGIGIYLSFSTAYPLITGTVAGSPAALAGLKAGDQIQKVGDRDIKGITPDQATALIQGPEGTNVTLTILRGTDTLTFTVTRAQIQVPTVRSATVGNRVLYVRIYQFGTQTSTEFARALTDGLPGSDGMILDLRGDPGGFISAADDVITQFVTSGETFETRGRGGTDRHKVGSKHAAPNVPLVVLVDANSASASEAGRDDHIRQRVGAGGLRPERRLGSPPDGRAVVPAKRCHDRPQGPDAGRAGDAGQPCEPVRRRAAIAGVRQGHPAECGVGCPVGWVDWAARFSRAVSSAG